METVNQTMNMAGKIGIGWAILWVVVIGFLLFLFGLYRGIETQKRRPQVISNALDSVRSTWVDKRADLIRKADDAKLELERIEAEAMNELKNRFAELRTRVRDYVGNVVGDTIKGR